MPVVQVIVGHLKEEPGLQTQGVLMAHPQGQSQAVRLGEFHPEFLIDQQIGVGPHHLQRHVAVGPVKEGCQLQRELMLGQKLHQPAGAHLLAEGLSDLAGPLG